MPARAVMLVSLVTQGHSWEFRLYFLLRTNEVRGSRKDLIYGVLEGHFGAEK